MLKRLVGRIVALFLLLGALAACDSLPSDVEQSASRINRGITELGETLALRQREFEAVQANAEQWPFFQSYAEREDWKAIFTAVTGELDLLRRRYDAEVSPIVEADKSEDAERLRGLLEGIASNFDPIRDRINAVNGRMSLLREGYENASAWVVNARSFIEQIEASVASVQRDREQAKVDFPSRETDIDERFSPLNRLLIEAQSALTVVDAEFAKHETGEDADYADFADAYTTTRDNTAAAILKTEEYREQLASLYKEYTTVLRDMRVEYVVVIAREAWNSNSDARYPAVAYPPVTISHASYDYLISLAPGERQGQSENIARRSSSWSSWNDEVFIDSAVWREIGIDMGASWDSSTNDSQFWIEDIYPVYFHRYADINGTTLTEGKWEEVDEAEFGLYVNAFGMAIEQKALGRFADEAVVEPAPAGIDMVGDPRYGKWVPDGNGGQQWSWIEQYAFYHLLLGPDPYYYSRADYRDYRSWRDERDRRGTVTAANYGWYGSNRNSPTFGTSGRVTAQSVAYRNSPFASSGGVERIPPSVREAGATTRGRGPGSAGK